MDGFEFQYTFDNKEDTPFTPNAILQPTPSSRMGYRQADSDLHLLRQRTAGCAPDADRRQSLGLSYRTENLPFREPA